MARDKIAEIRDRLAKIADADTRLVWAMRKFVNGGMGRAELELLLDPLVSEADIQAKGFKNRAEVRIAWYSTMPRSAWPAAMQAAHERVDSIARREAKTDHSAGINVLMVSIPAPQGQLTPTADVVRFRRTKKGTLKRIIDVDPLALPAAEDEEGEEGVG